MIIPNILNEKQIAAVQDSINATKNKETQQRYGRYMFHDVHWNEDTLLASTLTHVVNEATNGEYVWAGAGVAEYTAEAGEPNLPPHFDGDSTDLIMTYQLKSNKPWGVGVDLNVYVLEDNAGVIFHPNESIHWRPHTKFNDGEFVRVLFVRFRLPVMTDYGHMMFSQDNPIFDEVKAFRDSL